MTRMRSRLGFVRVLFLSSVSYCVSISIKLDAGQTRVNDLFTYWYEIRNCCGPTWTTAFVRSGRGLGTRYARFLGQRLRRRLPLRPDPSHAYQPAQPLSSFCQQTAPLSKTSRSTL